MTNKNEKDHDREFQWHCVQQKNRGNCDHECFLQDALALFGKKHTLSIIRLLLMNDKLRFNEIESAIGGSPKTITRRLRELEARGIITRKEFMEIPIRVEYSLTGAGRSLDAAFEELSRWVMKVSEQDKK